MQRTGEGQEIDTKEAYARRICLFCVQMALTGILSGRTVIISLKTALPVVSHSVALFRRIFPCLLFEYVVESGSPGGLGILLPGTAFFPFRLLYAGYHLNRIHFEIGSKSVCCVNPSLDAYFNSAVPVFLLIISAKTWKKLPISKINIKSPFGGQSEIMGEKKR